MLRLFAQAREAAGIGKVEIAGSTVQEVLAAATEAYGSDFEQILGISNVWVNGQQADFGTAVTSGDEVAVLPPVSGG